VILLATLLAHAGSASTPKQGAPNAGDEVIVEMVQTAPGQTATGFRIGPDGTWSDLDGAWTVRQRLDAAALRSASDAVAAVGDVTVPAAVVTDAVGTTSWRLGTRTVSVPDGVDVPALSVLYTRLQALAVPAPATSVWTIDGVAHGVGCSASSIPVLSALTRIWTTAPPAPEQRALELTGVPRVDVRWLEAGLEVGRSVVLLDGRVGSSFEGKLTHRGTLDAAGLTRLGAALAAVDWSSVCR